MQNTYDKISNYLFYFLIVIAIFFLIFIWHSKHEKISFNNEPMYLLNDHWSYVDQEGNINVISLPSTIEANKQDKIRISRVLPSDNTDITTIGLFTAHQSIDVYIEDKLIYNFHVKNENGLFSLPSGSFWNIIRLPKDSSGKTITIELTADYKDYAGVVNEIYAGTKSSILLHIFNSKVLNVLLSLCIIFIGVTSIIVYFTFKKLLKSNMSLFYLGWSVILASTWMIMESELAQFFLNNNFFEAALTYLSLMLIPIPFLKYIALAENYRYKRFILILSNILSINSLTLIGLQLFNVLDFHDSLFILHLFMYIIFTIVFITLCLDSFKYKNKDIRYITLSSGFLFTFAVIELVAYKSKTDFQTGTFLQFGFLAFTLMLAWVSIKKLVNIIRLSETARHYQYLATRDYLTKCKNRAAYAMDLDNITLQLPTTILLADINSMKIINDNYGHQVGDEALIKCSQILFKVFGSTENCYRIGGDEFVCIVFDLNEEQINQQIKLFIDECIQISKNCSFPFEVSIGYAIFDALTDLDIHDTIRRADYNMYHNKMSYRN